MERRRFPFVPAEIPRWLRPVHAIESNCFCIGRAKGRTGGELQNDNKINDFVRPGVAGESSGVRVWDLVVPRMGRVRYDGHMSNQLPDPRLVSGTRKRIENSDYEALFTGGYCFHFALRLHERYGLKIRGVRSYGKTLSHVWCQKKGESKGIDIRGIYQEELLARLAIGGELPQIHEVSVDEVRAQVSAKHCPSELEKEILDLADRIVDTHERFQGAKPLDEKLYSQFVKDIEQSDN